MDTNSNSNSNTSTMLPIFTTVPKVAPTQSLISFRRKDTEKNPVADTDKFRGVLITPPYSLPVTSEALHEVFATAIEEAFYSAAGSILKAFCDQKENKDAKEVNASLFTFTAIVEKMASEQSSQRLSNEQVLAWFDASKTAADSITRYGSKEDKKYAVLREKFGALASPNPGGISPQAAQKMIAFINADDLDHPIMKTVMKKLEKLSIETADEL